MLDVLIRGGSVLDGTGSAALPADVGIADDRIAFVRVRPDGHGGHDVTVDAGTVVDADGKVVAPGFIDIHTHSDFTLLEERTARSVLRQGVTTEVVGNCGQSYAPVTERNRPMIVGRSSGWQPSVDVSWTTVGGYLDEVRKGNGANAFFLVGHGAVRSAVIGSDDRIATNGEIATMALLVDQAMDQGARGLSFGLEYPPGRSATSTELTALAQTVARRNGLVTSHVRNRDRHFEPAADEVLAVGRDTNVRLQVSHLLAKPGHRPGSWERVLEKIDEHRKAGFDVAADTIPYTTGPGFATAFLPPWAVEGGPKRILERLRDPEQYARIRMDYGRYWLFLEEGQWDRLTVSYSDAHPEWIGERFDVLSKHLAIEPIDVLLRLFLDEGEGLDRVGVNGLLFSEDHVRECLREPTFALASDGWRGTRDGGAGEAANHPNAWGFAPLILGHYVRETAVLQLEDAVRRMTSYPAQRLGLADRGVLREGAYADVVVFDPGTIGTASNYQRPAVRPTGIHDVFVNGARAVESCELTAVMAGRVL